MPALLLFPLLLLLSLLGGAAPGAEAAELSANREALRRVLSDEGLREYDALRAQGYLLRAQGHYDASHTAFRQAMRVYTGAMAAPYIDFALQPGMSRSDMERYARSPPSSGGGGAAPGSYHTEAGSFRAHELSKADSVAGALRMYSRTLHAPHRAPAAADEKEE